MQFSTNKMLYHMLDSHSVDVDEYGMADDA
jgi:hypothetical protein